MPLSVISALARLDLDPWAEAADLALLPPDGAAQRLASLLAEVLESSPRHPDRATVSARLVALLPASRAADGPSHGEWGGARTVPQTPAIGMMLLACLASMVAALWLTSLSPGSRASATTANPPPAASARN